MKVLGINSSAGKDGNTALLIGTVFEELNKEGIETEMIQLSGQVLEPCRACWACGGKKNCVHQEDLFQEIYEKMVQADGILLGSPVYTANISANMQAFLERASVVADMNRGENLLRHKVGAAVVAARRGGALNTLDAMNHFFMLQDMFIVGSSYWPMAYGRMPGEVLEDQEGLETMRNLGRNMAYLLKALKEHAAEPARGNGFAFQA
ncbi:MAG: flavodoxin family protein [Lachnospiraceae bacterium]|nr:flavodoxin family protein [Lachnospiraceae bacterium]